MGTTGRARNGTLPPPPRLPVLGTEEKRAGEETLPVMEQSAQGAGEKKAQDTALHCKTVSHSRPSPCAEPRSSSALAHLPAPLSRGVTGAQGCA